MTACRIVGSLCVDPLLADFVEEEVLPVCGLEAGVFWAGLERVIEECAPRNEVLLAVRDRIQSDLDEWHAAHPGPLRDAAEYVACLARIGYLVDEPGDFTVATQDIDGGAEANPQPGALTARRKCDE